MHFKYPAFLQQPYVAYHSCGSGMIHLAMNELDLVLSKMFSASSSEKDATI